VAKVGKHLKIAGLQLQLSLLRRRGNGEVVEKVGTVQCGDSTVSSKAEVLPEA
jgi:hypothetical protein